MITKYKVILPSGSFHESLLLSEAEQYALVNGIPLEQIQIVEEEEPSAEVNLKDTLRIYTFDLVHNNFKDLPPSKIDFIRHLKEGASLKKDVEMAKNGRPIKATYTYEGVLVAEILFVFQTDAMNFLTSRQEQLGYYDTSGVVPAYYTISSWSLNPQSQYDTTYVTKERKEARITIFDEIKSKLNLWIYAYYAPQGKSYMEILNIGGNFWTTYSNDIDSWINTGGKEGLQNRLNNDTEYTFLSSAISPEQTVKEYIQDRITY